MLVWDFRMHPVGTDVPGKLDIWVNLAFAAPNNGIRCSASPRSSSSFA